jgi:hypothetical protein
MKITPIQFNAQDSYYLELRARQPNPFQRPLVQSVGLSSIDFGHCGVTCSYVGLRPYPTLVQKRFKLYNRVG